MRRFTPSWSDYLCPKFVQGLVYLHLNKTRNLHRTLTIIDRTGQEHRVDLDQTEFVIQRKAELIFSYLHKLQSPQEVQEAIASLLQLVQNRIDKGFSDRDKAVSNNYGFVNGHPIHLDVGRLHRGHKPGELARIQRRIAREI